jgi:hypothetical protein
MREDDCDTLCFTRAKERGQRTFTLVEQDESSPLLICLWIAENIETAPWEKLVNALETAFAMRSYGARKTAD